MSPRLAWTLPLLLTVTLALPAAPPPRASDAQMEALAHEGLAASDPRVQAEVLKSLKLHHFKNSLAKEREFALFAQGTLEDRKGETARAAATFHRLEQSWPQSRFLADAQVVMAEAALERKRYKEAESRLHKALGAELPAEMVRRGQELLLWCLAEQGRSQEGIATAAALKPLGTARPSEKGLVGILEALCAARNRTEAESTVQDYHKLYPNGPRSRRVDLAWGKLLGTLGDAPNAARAFQALILANPASAEADEARLALATLLTDGKLPAKDAQGLPTAQALLSDLQKGSQKEGPVRQALLIRVRLALKDRRWKEAMDLTTQFRTLRPSGSEASLATDLRGEALRSWAQELLDQRRATPLLPYLDGEGIRMLTPALRLALAKGLAEGGLPEASRTLVNVAPTPERAGLQRAALAGIPSGLNPEGTLALLPVKNEDAQQLLLRAQASATLHAWPETRAALAKAKAGPGRIQTLVMLLSRPMDSGETLAARSHEAESWLSRAPEKGADREPLTLLVADLKTRNGDWRGALALYPSTPQPGNRGWVALMRATCLSHLGQVAPARATLKEAAESPDYLGERQALGQQLGL